MADTNANRQCRVCGIGFFQAKAPGRRAEYCSVACRKGNQGLFHKTHKSGYPCGFSGCSRTSVSKGYCHAHYAQLLAGKVLVPLFHKKRIIKHCEWCQAEMILKPRQAQEQRYCSRSCVGKGVVGQKGLVLKRTRFVCAGCHTEVNRPASSGTDALKFCTRECSYKLRQTISRETEALRAIAKAWRYVVPEHVQREIDALRRIARYCERKIRRPCDGCSLTLVNSGQGRRLCKLCLLDSKRAQKKKARLSALGRARKAIERANRRVRLTGRVEKIDPIAVFERDGWRCQLCNCPTPKRLRGQMQGQAPELDHIVPLSAGGQHTWSNVQCACRRCNGLKGARPLGQLNLPVAA